MKDSHHKAVPFGRRSFPLIAFTMSPPPLSSKLQGGGEAARDDGEVSGTLFEMGIRNLNRHKEG